MNHRMSRRIICSVQHYEFSYRWELSHVLNFMLLLFLNTLADIESYFVNIIICVTLIV